MKKTVQNLLLIAVFLISATSFAQNRSSVQKQAPMEIQNYVKEHFSDLKITEVEVDHDDGFKEYEIELSDGTDLEFNHEFKVKKIDGKSALPNAVIPQKIREYVQTNFPNRKITDWEFEGNHQEIQLNNDLELEFSLNGDFIRVDD